MKTRKTKSEILKSLFMTHEDFKTLVDLPKTAELSLYKELLKTIKARTDEAKVFLPDKYHLPTSMVIDFLKQYGFSEHEKEINSAPASNEVDLSGGSHLESTKELSHNTEKCQI